MLRIRLYLGSSSTEGYLNRKSKKGYQLDCIVPFGLFVPLRLDAYRFIKTTNKNRIYKVDSRSVSEDDLDDYIQLFKDDGWRIFKFNHSNGYYNNDYIFYSDDPNKKEIFSDEESKKRRNRENAIHCLIQAVLLIFMYAIALDIFNMPLRKEDPTFFEYILQNIGVVGAIIIVVFSFIKYWKNRV